MAPGRRVRPAGGGAGGPVVWTWVAAVAVGALVLLAGCGGRGTDAAARCRSGVGRDVRERIAGRAVALHLPACYDLRSRERFPVVYLLHGSGADESMWPDLGAGVRADALARSHRIPPMILVQPDFGEDPGAVIARRLARDVIPWVDAHRRTIADGAHRAVGGISLGASGALRAAAGSPGTFAGVGAVSPVVGGSTDAIVAGLGDQRLPVLVAVGSSDRRRAWALALADQLRVAGAEVQVVDRAGGHDRGFWRGQVDDDLLFYGALWR